eukprot:8843954-Pyramimonas_sp.AAC.2
MSETDAFGLEKYAVASKKQPTATRYNLDYSRFQDLDIDDDEPRRPGQLSGDELKAMEKIKDEVAAKYDNLEKDSVATGEEVLGSIDQMRNKFSTDLEKINASMELLKKQGATLSSTSCQATDHGWLETSSRHMYSPASRSACGRSLFQPGLVPSVATRSAPN